MPIRFFLLSILTFSLFAFAQQPAYLKIEEGDPLISVFNENGIGENWKYCKKNDKGECANAVGWLDKNAKVKVIGEKVKRKTIDPFTNQEVEEDYYPIEFEYVRDGWVVKRQGYVDAAYIEFKKHKSLIQPPEQKIENCSPISKDYLKHLEAVQCATEYDEAKKTSATIQSRIGVCANLAEDVNYEKLGLYDNIVIKHARTADITDLKDQLGEPITNEDLIDIDAMARTIYGEMASCFKHGLEYPMTVARVIMNRAEADAREAEFIRGNHLPEKGDVAKVCTSPTQFNAWMRKMHLPVKTKDDPKRNLATKKKLQVNPSMKMALCPPQTPPKPPPSSPQERAIWQHTVRIATEAILFPTMFKKKTEGVKDILFYTSGMGKFHSMIQQKGRDISGQPINKDKCLELWKEDPNAPPVRKKKKVVKKAET